MMSSGNWRNTMLMCYITFLEKIRSINCKMRQPRLTRGWISGPSRPKRNTALSVLWRNSIKPDANVAFLGKESKYLRSTAYKAEPEAPFLVYPRHRKCTQTFWKNVKPLTQFSLLLQNPVVIRLADVLLEAVQFLFAVDAGNARIVYVMHKVSVRHNIREKP